MTDLIVHSIIVNGNELVHNVQSDNLARLKQIRRLLTEIGYEVMSDIWSERGFHVLELWSFEDRSYTTVPRSPHTRLLKLLGIPVNNAHVRPNVISSYAVVKPLRTTRRRRPSSPVLMVQYGLARDSHSMIRHPPQHSR